MSGNLAECELVCAWWLDLHACGLSASECLQALACAAFHWCAHDLFKQLLEARQAYVASDKEGSSSADTACFSAVLEILSAVHTYQQASGNPADAAVSNAAVLLYAEQVSTHAAAAFRVLPDLATDAVYFLWQSAKPLLEGAVAAQDAAADEAVKVGMRIVLQLHTAGMLLHERLTCRGCTCHN